MARWTEVVTPSIAAMAAQEVAFLPLYSLPSGRPSPQISNPSNTSKVIRWYEAKTSP